MATPVCLRELRQDTHRTLFGGGRLRRDDRSAESRREKLCQAVERAAHLLPMQGPIGVFVHHNTLHAFEDRPFDPDGVASGAAISFRGEPDPARPP